MKLVWFLFMLNTFKPQLLDAAVDHAHVNVIRETGRMEIESRAAIPELLPTQASCKFSAPNHVSRALKQLWEKLFFTPSRCLSGGGYGPSSWWSSLGLDELSNVSKPDISYQHLAHQLTTFPSATCLVPPPSQCQARKPRAETQGTWQTTAKPRHDHHTCQTRPVYPAQDIGLQGRPANTSAVLPQRPTQETPVLLFPHTSTPPQHLLQETAVPPLLTKWLHNTYFCQPSGDRATSWTVHQQLLDIHFLNAFSAIQMNNYAS